MAMFGFTQQQCYGTDLDKETVDPRWGFSPRYAMQTLGERMRNIFGDDIWIKSAEATILGTKIDSSMPTGEIEIATDGVTYHGVVVTDVRYPNEAAMIRRNGGIVVRIDRPSLGPLTDTHPSETSMEGFEYDEVILNDGTIQDLHDKVRKLFIEYGTDHDSTNRTTPLFP